MALHVYKVGLAVMSLTFVGGLMTSQPAYAQDPGQEAPSGATDPANKKIDLDLESTNLYYGLKLLFSQVKQLFVQDLHWPLKLKNSLGQLVTQLS